MQVDGLRRMVDRPLLTAKRGEGQSVQWRGELESEAEGEYQLAVYLQGAVQIKLDDTVRLAAEAERPTWISGEPFLLKSGSSALVVNVSPTTTVDVVIGSAAVFNIYWRGPGFRWEPLPADRLTLGSHPPDEATLDVATGADLVRVLRCEACHTLSVRDREPLSSPSLQTAAGNLHPTWMLEFLERKKKPSSDNLMQDGLRHVHAQFSPSQAKDLVAWLQSLVEVASDSESSAVDSPGDAQRGRQLVYSLGCLACHGHDELGNAGVYGGGDLSNLDQKRPAGFIRRWLADPARLNAGHRMPRFELTVEQAADIEAFLLPEGTSRNDSTSGDVVAGRRLAEQHACLQCHHEATSANPRTALSSSSNWQRSCLQVGGVGRPAYGLATADVTAAVQDYVKSLQSPLAPTEGERILTENNCLQCHARGFQPGLTSLAGGLAEFEPDLLDLLPGMNPPALNSVGDKLHRSALQAVLQGEAEPLRPWLAVQMPKFHLPTETVDELVDYLISADRVPDVSSSDVVGESEANDSEVGEKLVTSAGFGCTSCHAIGRSRPAVNTPLNQRAPNLSLPQKRLRKVWFDRWVRNPARITPRMEMPSVQIPVQGVCDNDLNRQLDAVWSALNMRGFSPPDDEPTRFLLLGQDSTPVVLTDVIQLNGRKLIKPFLIGLPNGQNVLLDLHRARLAAWWSGIVAQQRTQGKTWFWQPGSGVVPELSDEPDIVLLIGGRPVVPVNDGQFPCDIDQWKTAAEGIELRYRLHFRRPDESALTSLSVTQHVTASPRGWRRDITVDGLRANENVGVRITSAPAQTSGVLRREGDFLVAETETEHRRRMTLEYEANSDYLAPEHAPQPAVSLSARRELSVMPGFELVQLPLPSDLMPVSLGWRRYGELLLGSLKGRLWSVRDSDGDDLLDLARPISDDLAAPYGIYATEQYVDVVNKHALIRLHDDDGDGKTDRHEVIAAGWGHTDDYHDWVVGLPRDADRNYYVSIPCQQDDREIAAGKFRGHVLQLVPEETGKYGIREISRGHRFPMGIALNQAGKLFVTDNQGNYNPFNELNHVLPGRHFGFINRLEQDNPPPAQVTPPAIAIPHPWTRSVNGICFLESADSEHDFGPFTGHLVGCEYDTRRLIRMTLDEVDGWIQGAAYPLAEAGDDPEDGLQGPINCGVAPSGDLYIANIRDSGWGGGNNTGSIVRARFNPRLLPPGIAEVTAIDGGFRFVFTHPVQRQLAADAANYECSSYRRVSTPAYGGDDVDRRRESILSVDVAEDQRSVDVILPELRAGFVYAWKLANLVGNSKPFYPAEAHYSLQRLKTAKR